MTYYFKGVLRAVCTVFILGFATINVVAQEAVEGITTPPVEVETAVEGLNSLEGLPTIDLQKSTVYAEYGTNGSLMSVNYDQVLFAFKNAKVSTSLGLGLSSSVFDGDVDPIIPIQANVLFGKKGHHLEVGGGVMGAFGFDETTFSLNNNDTTEPVDGPTSGHGVTGGNGNSVNVWQVTPEKEYVSLYTTAHIGYRYQANNGGLFVKAGFKPMFNVYSKTDKQSPQLGGAIAVGYTFKNKTSKVPVLFYN